MSVNEAEAKQGLVKSWMLAGMIASAQVGKLPPLKNFLRETVDEDDLPQSEM